MFFNNTIMNTIIKVKVSFSLYFCDFLIKASDIFIHFHPLPPKYTTVVKHNVTRDTFIYKERMRNE